MKRDDRSRALTREAQATAAFVALVSALADDVDAGDVLSGLSTSCAELSGAAAAGILLADEHGTMRVVNASNERAHRLQALQVEHDEGPCLDCVRTGRTTSNADMRIGAPWPVFAAASLAEGYPSVCAIPMRIKGSTVGCLNLFLSEPVEMAPDDLALAQGLADVASIAIAQHRSSERAAERERQLQHALESRIVIEQAKGMIAVQRGVTIDAAFAWLRNHARNNSRRLADVARDVVAGSLAAAPGGPAQRSRTPAPGPSDRRDHPRASADDHRRT